MNDLSQTLKKGTLLLVETGEYSDRNWHGPVRMTGDFVKADLVEEFKRDWKPPNEYDTEPDPTDFLPWLISSGKAETVDDIHSWHVGSYGSFEPT